MNRSSNCHDNVVAESYFQLLEEERTKCRIHLTRKQPINDAFDCIAMFYTEPSRIMHRQHVSDAGPERHGETLGLVYARKQTAAHPKEDMA